MPTARKNSTGPHFSDWSPGYPLLRPWAWFGGLAGAVVLGIVTMGMIGSLANGI